MIQSDRSPTRCHFERRKNGWMLTVLLVVVECPALYEIFFNVHKEREYSCVHVLTAESNTVKTVYNIPRYLLKVHALII